MLSRAQSQFTGTAWGFIHLRTATWRERCLCDKSKRVLLHHGNPDSGINWDINLFFQKSFIHDCGRPNNSDMTFLISKEWGRNKKNHLTDWLTVVFPVWKENQAVVQHVETYVVVYVVRVGPRLDQANAWRGNERPTHGWGWPTGNPESHGLYRQSKIHLHLRP